MNGTQDPAAAKQLTPNQSAVVALLKTLGLEEHIPTVAGLDPVQVDRWAVRCCQLLRDRVPAGRYAVVMPQGLRFYKVDRPTEGRWAGYTFVKVQASDELHPVRNRADRDGILAAIGMDPQAAMERYGREIGRCGHCGRTLTNEESLARGIGPVCAEGMGW